MSGWTLLFTLVGGVIVVAFLAFRIVPGVRNDWPTEDELHDMLLEDRVRAAERRAKVLIENANRALKRVWFVVGILVLVAVIGSLAGQEQQNDIEEVAAVSLERANDAELLAARTEDLAMENAALLAQQDYDRCISNNVRTTAGREARLSDVAAAQQELDLLRDLPGLVAEEIPGYLELEDPAARLVIDSFLGFTSATREVDIAALEIDVERLQDEYDTYVADQSPSDCGDDPSET